MEYSNEEERLKAARERLQAGREFDTDIGMDYGVGFDALTNDVRGDCVIRTTPESPVGAGGQEIFFSLDQISDYSSFASALNISVSASLKATFGRGSAKVNFLSEQKINQYSIYLLIRVSVKNAPKRMRDVKLKSDAFDLLKRKGSEAFRKRCGDEFIVGISTGGEFFGIFEIKTEDQTDKQTIEGSLRASGALGAWKAGVDFKTAVENVRKTRKIRAVVLQRGGANTTVPATVDEMIERAINFPASVAGDAAKPILGTFLSYETLELPDGKNPIDIQQQQDVLLKLASYRLDYLNLLANIEYILNNPTEFEEFDPLNLQGKANLVRETLNNIAKSASVCFNDYTQCKLLSLPLLDTSLPSRNSEEMYEGKSLCEKLTRNTLSTSVSNKVFEAFSTLGINLVQNPEGGWTPVEGCGSALNRLQKAINYDEITATPPFRDYRIIHALAPNLENITAYEITNKDLNHISRFSNLKRFTVSHYGNVEILDFNALSNLTSFDHLILTSAEDFTSLSSLTKLKKLELSPSIDKENVSLDSLRISNLEELYLRGYSIENSEFLASLRSLKSLYISKPKSLNLVDLSPLAGTLTNLTLVGCEIVDLSFLRDLKNLTSLILRGNKIRDLSPISSLKKLETINLAENQIENLTPLRSLNSLNNLDVSYNLIKDGEQIYWFYGRIPVGGEYGGFQYSNNPLPPIEFFDSFSDSLLPIEIFRTMDGG